MAKKQKDLLETISGRLLPLLEDEQLGDYTVKFKNRARLQLGLMGAQTLLVGKLQADKVEYDKETDVLMTFVSHDDEYGVFARQQLLSAIVANEDPQLFDKIAVALGANADDLRLELILEWMPKIQAGLK